MKLDSKVSKVFASRDGYFAVFAHPGESRPWIVITHDEWNWVEEGDELDGEWLPVETPKFPELPPKPGLVLFTQEHWGPSEIYWGTVDNGILYVASPKCGHGATYKLAHAKIVIIPHPHNDDEAVRLIEEAKR